MRALPLAFSLLVALGGAAASAESAPRHDYPTAARADYVFACMATNGQTRVALEKCSCSIDAIAEQLSSDDYVKAETVMSLQLAPGGDRVAMFRQAPWAAAMIDRLKQAQIEAELRCF